MLLVGDHDFTAAAPAHSDLPALNLAGRLLAALQAEPGNSSTELLVQQYHIDAMGAAAWAALHATGKARVLDDPGPGKAIVPSPPSAR